MRFLFILLTMIHVSWSQTRPTGGTGPDVDETISRVTSLGAQDLLISEKFEKQFDRCGVKFTKPNEINIYQIYLTLYPLRFLNTLTAIKLHQLQYSSECPVAPIHLDPWMMCLFSGSEVYLNSFVNDREARRYLKDQYNLKAKEADDVLEFFRMINFSIQVEPVKK